MAKTVFYCSDHLLFRSFINIIESILPYRYVFCAYLQKQYVLLHATLHKVIAAQNTVEHLHMLIFVFEYCSGENRIHAGILLHSYFL